MIKPTVGRVVWYHPGSSEVGFNGTDDPLAALVCHVWSDTCINIAFFDRNGIAYSKTSVPLLQEGGERPSEQFAEWMPYQKGQAAKTDAMEKKIADSKPFPQPV